MSLGPPHLPSPAPTLTPGATGPVQPGYTGPMDQASLRTELEAQLLRLTQDLYELEICAGDVGEGMEDAVPNYLMKVNQGYVSLSQLASQMTDTVPRQVIDHIDRFKNPHLHTKTVITRATGENQYALGRILGLESFRRQLHDALNEEFPEIPLPERRHQPVKGDSKEETERTDQVDGSKADAIPTANGESLIKQEEGTNSLTYGGPPNGTT
ncbi:hypothetical protein IAU60_003859 [Kwoniella sp. DSM 27419]